MTTLRALNMCAVSAVGDDWTKHFPSRFPSQPWESPFPSTRTFIPLPGPSREEFEQLKKDVEQMKLELEAAKKQDEENGEPDCEMEDKVALLKKVAEAVGVDLSTIWPEEKKADK